MRLSEAAHFHLLEPTRFTSSACRRVRTFWDNTGRLSDVHRCASVVTSVLVQMATLSGAVPSRASSYRLCGGTASHTPCIVLRLRMSAVTLVGGLDVASIAE